MYSSKNNKTNKNLVSRDDLFCKHCDKQCKNLNSLHQHEIRCPSNPNRIPSVSKGICNIPLEKRGWSKGLTKDTDERVNNISKGVNSYLETHEASFKGKHHTEETRKFLSENASKNNFQSHWGTRKSYVYNGEVFTSSFEVDVVRDLDKNNIKWEKPDYGIFKYVDCNNKQHTYTPDIYLPDFDVYLDPKNDFLIENKNPALGYKDCDKIKWVSEQNNVRIIILNKNQLSWEVIKSLI